MFAKPRVETSRPVNRQFFLNKGRARWWLTVPWYFGGPKWFDLVNGAAATANGTSNVWQSGGRGVGAGQIVLDGTTSYLAAPTSTLVGFTQFSLAFWGYRPTTATRQLLTQYTDANNGFFFGGGGDGNFYAIFTVAGTSTGFFSNGVNQPSAGLHRFLMTFDGTLTGVIRVTTFLDGTATTGGSTQNGGAGVSVYPSYTGTFNFGFGSGPATFSSGWIDDVSVWNRVLSAKDIQADYREGLLGYPNSLNYHRTRGYASAVAPGNPITRRSRAFGPGYRAGSRGVA